MTPRCWCGKPSKLSDQPQTKEQFDKNLDTYVCSEGHVFETTIPIKSEDGYAVRADI